MSCGRIGELVTAIALLAIGCGNAEEPNKLIPPQVGFEAPKRVVLVTIDTLRADHLPFHGYPRDTAPFLSEIAARSAVFEHALSASSHTNPSHASIFTGLHLPQHKVLSNGQVDLDSSLRTLAHLHREAGFETAGFVSVAWLRLLKDGFNAFDVAPVSGDPQEKVHYAQATLTVDRALAWLEERPEDPRFFLWVHLYDPHAPYRAPAPFVDRMKPGPLEKLRLLNHWTRVQGKDQGKHHDFASLQSSYDAEIAYADAELERLYEAARIQGWLGDSLWIFTADHGEGMRSHGYDGHGRHIYQEQLRVPLVVHHPDGGFNTGRIGSRVHHIDLFPTLAEIIGSGPAQAATLHGVSLLPLLTGEVSELSKRSFYSQRRRKRPNGRADDWAQGPIYALQDDRFKYIYKSVDEDEFYDLQSDPLEAENLVRVGGARAEAWRERTTTFFERLERESAAVDAAEASQEDREALHALGYFE